MHTEAHRLLRTLSEIHPNISVNPSPGQTENERNYLIIFTPRSGSTWLTELLQSNKTFGNPEEWFNPDFIPANAKKLHVNNFHDYVVAIKSGERSKSSEIFGAEITPFQLQLASQLVDFFSLFPTHTTKYFYLRRKNILAQAISLYHATETGQFHTITTERPQLRTAQYDALRISYWLDHLLEQEHLIERLLRTERVSPTPIYYETMMSMLPRRTVCHIHTELFGKPFSGPVVMPTQNKKLLSQQITKWQDRYRSENELHIRSIERNRPAL